MTLKQDREAVTKWFEKWFKENPGMYAIRVPDKIYSIMKKRIMTVKRPGYSGPGPSMIFLPEKKPLGAPVDYKEDGDS